MSARILTVYAVVLLSLAATALGQQAPGDAGIDALLQRRAFADAVQKIDAALPNAKGGEREYLLYRRGLALALSERPADAISQFEGQIKEFPDGTWAHKARFRLADAHAVLKQYDAAERVYAEEVRGLVGDARKARLAAVYLDFAQEYDSPKDSLVKPDFAKARTFYEKALELEPGDAMRDTLLHKRAWCSEKLEAWADAAKQYHEYLIAFDSAYRQTQKQRMAGAPLPPPAAQPGVNCRDARFNLASCQIRQHALADARRTIQDLLSLIAVSAAGADDPKLRDLTINATYLLSKTYGMPRPPDGDMLTLGVQVLDGLISRFPSAEKSIQAAHDLGVAQAHRGRTDAAIAAFRALVDRTVIRPDGDDTRKFAETLSQDALFSIARLLFQQKKYADAIGVWNQYVARYPSGPQWSASQQAIVDAEFQIGADSIAAKRYDEGRAAWETFLQKYPLDPRAPGVLFAFGEIELRTQKERQKQGQTPDWSIPITTWRRLVSKYAGSEEAGKAQYLIGDTLETGALDLEGAIAEYSKLNWSSYAAAAQKRLAEMRSTRLDLLTERTIRTDEKARVRLDMRNVDVLTLKLFRLDMEDFFRKSHGLSAVDALDLLLIDPDQTLEIPIKDYAKYKPITQEMDLPFEGPGVFAVMATNEKSKLVSGPDITPAKLQATTLVLRSDIDIIVKSSLRQMLVFAQNMRTGHPAENVNVLVSGMLPPLNPSDGSGLVPRVFLTGKTGADGVWKIASDDLKKVADPIVLAVIDGHVAGAGLSLGNLSMASGLGPRGYLYTDRPAYRPGEAVNIRGILREAKDGQYTLPTQPEDPRLRWQVDVVDAKGRVLRSDEAHLTEFGTFAAQFRIADDAPVGTYKLIARRAGGPTFSGEFLVQSFELPKAFIQVEPDEAVILRGQPIKGSLLLKYQYGEPVADKQVEYALHASNGEVIQRSGVTDKAGRVAFEFESATLPEESFATVVARQAELQLQAQGVVRVAVRAFRAEARTQRPFYLSEEPVEVTIKTRDLKEKSIRQDMSVTAYLRTSDGRTWSETKTESASATTDEKTGEARVSLKLTKGGQYVIRVEGKDKFEHVVTAEAMVQVSDDEDETRLRVFSDRETYKVGETIALDVHARPFDSPKSGSAAEKPAADPSKSLAAPLLALVTYEGEEIIGYRTMPIAAGHNKLDIAVGHEHFPNFAVGVAVMAGNRFYSASREFTVQRQLNVTLTPKSAGADGGKPDPLVLRPRDTLNVDIQVTDHQGKPVRGELSLTMIDNALLTRFPDNTPDIVEFFQTGARRTAALRTQASCVFRFAATTRPMVSDVLAEAERLEEAKVAALERPGSPPPPAVGPAGGVFGGGAGGGRFAGADQLDRASSADDENRQEMQDESQSIADDLDAAAGISADFGGAGRRASQPAAKKPARGARSSVGKDAKGVEWSLSSEPAPADEVGRQVLITGSREKVEEVAQMLDVLRARVDVGQVMLGTAFEYDKAVGDLARNAAPRTFFPDVAYWNPLIVTDQAGKASVSIVLPDSSTKWKLIARGVTKETLVGSGDAEVTARQDFFAELLTPTSVVEGDSFRPAARVHCQTPYKGTVEVTFKFSPRAYAGGTAVGEESTQKRTVQIDGTGVIDVEFDSVKAGGAGEWAAALEAVSQTAPQGGDAKLADAAAKTIAVRPWGMRVEAHKSGVGRDSDFVEIELPADAGDVHDRMLSVVVGASMPRWLIEEALESGARWEGINKSLGGWRVVPPRTNADTAAALLAALYAADYVRARAETAGTEHERNADARLLDERIGGLVAQLLSAQNEDGGLSWCGGKGASDPWTTATVGWSLGKARKDGHAIADAAISKLTDYLQKAFAAAGTEQTELKAITLHGISWLTDADFAHANRLYRNRDSLSAAALGHLALTFIRLDRKPIAAELLAILEHRLSESKLGRETIRSLPAQGCSEWMGSSLEVTALALLAQLSVDPRNASVRPMVNYLVGTCRADGWRPHKARGAVIAALCTYYGGAQLEASAFELNVSVNGKPAGKLTPDGAGSLRIDLSGADLAPGKQRVDFAFAGRGEYAWAVTMSGFGKGFPNPIGNAGEPVWAQERWYEPPVKEYKGRPVPTGFGVTPSHRWYVNRASKVPQGKVVPVHVNYGRHDNNSRNGAGDADYIVVQETIPAGFRLLDETVRGSFLAHDYADGVLTLYYGAGHLGNLEYQMVATTPGEYRVPPTIVRSLYRPERFNLNPPNTLTVLLRNELSDDPYRATPDELYNLARFNFDDGDFEPAAKLLTELLAARDWALADEPYRESVRMLLGCALARQDAEGVVDYFEILKEKYPTLLVPFEQIIRVADAYARTNQHERAYLIYRATADASFTTDTAIGGVLQGEGRFLDGVDFLENLWLEFPDTPQIESLTYAFAQALYAQADNAGALRQRRPGKAVFARPGGGELPPKVTRGAIIQEAIDALERFVTLHPLSPIADEAAYSLASAYLDLDQAETAIARAQQWIETFPKSRWQDRYRYIQALGHFKLGHFDQARQLAEQVAASTVRDEQGVERPSPNRALALYIIGQIHHAMGESAKAIEFYRKVKEQFSDAAQALNWFERRFIRMPEVTLFHPDSQGFRESDEWERHLKAKAATKPGVVTISVPDLSKPSKAAASVGEDAPKYPTPFVELGFRNLQSAVLQVYRVDLMKLALVEKNLSQIAAVNLAGIKPLIERTVTLADGLSYKDQSLRVQLDLPVRKDSSDVTGAYLVICRSDELLASGLVLVTPLALEVQETPGDTQVRVNVVDALTRGGLKDVHVKVIGSAMDRFISGESDLRGLFAAGGVFGAPTAIARDAGGHFAFYRSEAVAIAAATKAEPQGPAQQQADYFGNLRMENRKFQTDNDARLQQIYKGKQQRGVEVQRAQ
ncbi:MAG: outer membrane protein assembly factor BamD [Planctomycetes bacterium]|nr:outer membrane protein assembly factor BamD [Planctomycetota bacterium]